MFKLVERHKEIYKYYNKKFDNRTKHDFEPLFINNNMINEQDLLKQLKANNVDAKQFFYNAVIAKATFSLASTIQYLSGHYYIQEFSSQLCSRALLKPTKDKVNILDMCAAPGGKTINLSVLAPNSKIDALEKHRARLAGLYTNLNRMMIGNVDVHHIDAVECPSLKKKYDYVLLDAPCSGNFMNERQWYDKRSLKDFTNRQKIQKELLLSALKVMDKNSTLVYSTCSLEPEENEAVIDFALKHFDIIDIKDKVIIENSVPAMTSFQNNKYNPKVKKARRILHNSKFTPFFIAKLKKK